MNRQLKSPLTLAAVALAGLHPAVAAPIPIPNPSFEHRETYDPFTPGTDKYNQWGQESWRHFEVDNNGGPLRIWKPGDPANPAHLTTQGIADVGFGGSAPDGDYVVVVRSRYNDDEFHSPPQVRDFEAAVQLLTDTFDPNMTYTLTAKVGRLPEGVAEGGSVNYNPSWYGYAVQLAVGGTNVSGATYQGRVEGGTVIAEDNNSLTVPPNTFVTSTVVYTPDSANDHLAGQPLQIRVCALENPANHALTGWAAFDDITLEATLGPPLPDFKLVITPNAPTSRFKLDWESQAGMRYRVLSNTDLGTPPASWSEVAADIAATPPTNTYNVDPTETDLFYIVEEYPAPPVEIFAENFDGAAGPGLPIDWTSGKNPADNSSLTNWELGTPANVGPIPPGVPLPSGANCVATNISGNYDDPVADLGVAHTDIWLRSAPINLGAATAGTLSFQQWTQIEDVPGDLDYGSIRILDASDDSVLATMENRSIDGSTSGWEEYSMELPAAAFTAALGTIKVEWQFEADDIDSFAGWYIDDVAVSVPGS